MCCSLFSLLTFNIKHTFLILLTNILLDKGIPLLIPKLKSYWNFKIPPCRALLRGLRQISLVVTHVFPLSYSYYYYYYYMRCGIHSYLLLCVSRAVAKRKTIFQPFCVFGATCRHSGRGGREMEMETGVVWLWYLMGHRKYWKNVVLMRHKEIKFH